VATLCNIANSNPSALARSVADVYLADKLGSTTAFVSAPATPPRQVVTLTNAELQQWVGTYRSMANGSPRVLTLEGDKLVATIGQTKVDLSPHSATQFTAVTGSNTVLLSFERGPDGRRIRQWFGGQEGPPFVEFVATSLPLTAFAGTFHSEELAASFTITVAGDALQVKTASGETRPFQQVREGMFVSGGVTLRFDPVRDGRSDGFALDMGRVRGIRFVRPR
jgi:hypothetical protein